MKSVIVVVCEGGRSKIRDQYRAENYLHTMRQWINQETSIEYEAITVEQNTGAKRGIFEEAASRLARESRIPFSYHIVFGAPFRRGWVLNVGAKIATGNELLFADADAFVSSDFIQKLDKWITETQPKSAIAWETFYRLTEIGRKKVLQTGEFQAEYSFQINKPTAHGAAGGLNYFDRNFFFNELGGWNETFSLGAGGDNDMVLRAVMLEGRLNTMPYTLLHLWHPGKIAGQDSQELWSFTQKHTQVVTDEIKRLGVGATRPSVYSMAELSERYRLE